MNNVIFSQTGTSTNNIVVSYTGETNNTSVTLKKTEIGPRLYFSYVKSKLCPVDLLKLKHKMEKLKTLIPQMKISGQQSAYEELCRLLISAVKEQEAVVSGYDTFLTTKDINKFMSAVKDRCVKFNKLESFTRPIPKEAMEKILDVKELNIFDDFWILFVDYTKEVLKTNKEKIREKDPIVFGVIALDPEKLFYITDWVDEYCDLTLKEVVEKMKNVKDFKVHQVGDIELSKLEKEVMERYERLKKTNPSNFRFLMDEEDKKTHNNIFMRLWRGLLSKNLFL